MVLIEEKSNKISATTFTANTCLWHNHQMQQNCCTFTHINPTVIHKLHNEHWSKTEFCELVSWKNPEE
jgi:hypothetical protein